MELKKDEHAPLKARTEDCKKMYQERLKRFDEIVALCPDIERKGKSMPYCSTNGHMFALLNKAGDLGFRLGQDGMAAFLAKHDDSGPLKSHGATMRGYVRIPDAMLADTDMMITCLRQAQAYVESLPPK